MSYYLSATVPDLASAQPGPRGEPLPSDEVEGVVVLVGDDGTIQASTRMRGVYGLLLTDRGLLAATPTRVVLFSLDLEHVRPWTSHPGFNDLHSLRAWRDRLLVTSSGTDALVEMDAERRVVWQWWATENDFDRDSLGDQRTVDPSADHRGVEYKTRLRTTHVNSALRLSVDDVVATLFWQDALVHIDTATGQSTPVVSDLSRPHSVRPVAPGVVSVADTGHGRALVVDLGACSKVRVAESVEVDTEWLKDAVYVDGMWWLVDSATSHVVVKRPGGQEVMRHCFDPAWRLYELAVVAG